MMYKVCSNRSFLRARLWLLSLVLLLPIRMMGAGFTPTEGGLVVNLEPGDRFLLSVMVDHDNDPATPAKEYFVCDYPSYHGGPYNYAAENYLKLMEQTNATKPSDVSIWTVDTALVREKKYALGGIAYTMWGNSNNTLLAESGNKYQFFGNLTSSTATNDNKCDVAFVMPTNRSTVTSFDLSNTMGRGAKFNGEKGFGYAGLPYREVYWLEIPRLNGPRTYTNAALVTFNTSTSTVKWYKNTLTIGPGRTCYVYEDHTTAKPHHLTPRTIFRLYLLNKPLTNCPDSYFFATDEQDYKRYRANDNNPQQSSDSTAARKTYTVDWMYCMEQIGSTTKHQTDLMRVPTNDSTYFYVGRRNAYRNAGSAIKLDSTGTAVSQFKKISTLEIDGLSGYKAPKGALGRMVVNTTSTAQNLAVAWRPAGFFLRTSSGRNIRMKQTGEYEWTCEEMWHITAAYAALQIKATMFSDAEYSDEDTGLDIPGWSVMVTGTDVPVVGGGDIIGMDGWARIHTNSTEENGAIEFVPANGTRYVHYDNNGLVGSQIPDQYPVYGKTKVCVEEPRLVGGFDFEGWTTNADGTGTLYHPGDSIVLPTGELTLYAKATFTGTIHVAFSFVQDGQRYYLAQPGLNGFRVAHARPTTDWTDTYQGMADVENSEPNYISTYKLLSGPDPCKECVAGEVVLDPRQEMRHGAIDSLLFYEVHPSEEEYVGLYYTDPNVIVANDTWAGLFTSTAGWPNYSNADVQNAKLRSTHYLHRVNGDITRDERSNSSASWVKYNSATDQFDGVSSEDDATVFQIARVRVADEHYVVIPDTTEEAWTNAIEFGYHEDEQTVEQVRSRLIGKQLMVMTKVGDEVVYFHPNPDKILTTANELRLSANYRLTQNFSYIRDARIESMSTVVADANKPHMSTASNDFSRVITSGMSSPVINEQYQGNYINIVDTLRISLNPTGTGKIKDYYGRWKDGAPGLHIRPDGSRYRDILVTTKTYHYGATQTRLVLRPEYEDYIFNPFAGTSKTINFTLTKETVRQLLDVEGNPIGEVEILSSEDVTSSLALGPGACSFSAGGTYFAVNNEQTVSQHATLYTRSENSSEGENEDTLIVSTTVTIDGVPYPATTRVPLLQTTTYFDELIWSATAGSTRYYIMANSSGLIFHEYTLKNNTLYKKGTSTQLKVGAASTTTDEYITPWKFTYVSGHPDQLTLNTEYGVDKNFVINGSTGEASTASPTVLTYRYETIYRNANGNEEEMVRLKYGPNQWLKFQVEDGVPSITLQSDSATATVFSWGYMDREYYLTNNGDYPDKENLEFFYNRTSTGTIQTRYKAYRHYSMLIGNKLTYLCREDENDIADLINSSGDWKTNYSITRIRDSRSFDGGTKLSGLTVSTDAITLTTSVTPEGDSPMDVKIGGKYVNIVDTLEVQVSLQNNAPEYRFSDGWSSYSSVDDAHLKLPLIRRTYHEAPFDSLVCVVENDEYNYAFSPRIVEGSNDEHTFVFGTELRTGRHVLDVYNEPVAFIETDEEDVTGGMDLTDPALAEVRLVDGHGNSPSWCRIEGKTANTITVKALQDGIRSPRLAYIYLAYMVDVGGGTMRFVSFRLTISQASLFTYANNQRLVHTTGASGDEVQANGMQQVHTNRQKLYYYNPSNINHSPDQNVELPVRERAFYGWWRWYRESDDPEIGDSDIPDSIWVNPPRNVGKNNKNRMPYRTIGDSVWIDENNHALGKKLVTMGRYTVFHYPAKDYGDKNDPPSKNPLVCPPVDKATVVYAVDISNYYDNLPLAMSPVNQADTAMLDTMTIITEPTLSLREVFELHPWTEMADTMEHYKYADATADGRNSHMEKYMEDHVVMAPTGNRLLLSTEQRYNKKNLSDHGHSESLLGYYMRDDNWSTAGWDAARQDTMIWCGGWDANCKWYTYDPQKGTYAACTHTVMAETDFLQVPARSNITTGHEFDTVYYYLRARSIKTTTAGTASDPDPETPAAGDNWFNICRYMIVYHWANKYGPKEEIRGTALITNDEIEQKYEVLERLDFDYNKPGSDYTIYPHPLPWGDASYGYTYPLSSTLPVNRYHDQQDFPNHGEYGIINRIPYNQYWRLMQQHGGAENGYMIYCDGMASAGQVAALTLNTNLCAGQKMFFSGYVGNPSSQTGKSDPNFIISVQGSENGTDWDDITSYMTGDIKPSNNWYQVYFPINHNNGNKSYTHFRVRIYNVAANFDGNDFVIDDMCIFATKPPLIAYQANTACKEKGEEEEPSHVILRVDYQGITGEGYNNASVYYTVKRVTPSRETSFVDMVDGYLNRELHHDTICGRLYIPAREYVPTDPDSMFVNLAQLIDSFDVSNGVFKEGYIHEILEGETRPVKYVIHKALLNPTDTFTVHMSSDYGELLSSICGMTSHLDVSSQMVLELNGEEQPDTEQFGLCANSTYDIGLRVKGSLYQDNAAPVDLNGSCINDWLLYGDTAEVSSEARYGYKYSDIVKVVKDILRCVPAGTTNANQSAPNLAAVSRNEMQRIMDSELVDLDTDDHPYDVLAHLVNSGFLELYQANVTATVYSGDSVQYVIFPILGTGNDAMNDASVEVCPVPIFIKLKPAAGSGAPLVIGGQHRSKSEMNQPLVVLADASMAGQEIKVKVDSIMPMVGIYSVELRMTDDPDYREGVHLLAFEPDRAYPGNDYYVKGDTITFSPASTNTYTMKPGYSYEYDIVMQTATGSLTIDPTDPNSCRVGTVPFTVSIVPDYLRWDPQDSESNQWNKPGNWIGINEANQPIHTNARFAPLNSTVVIIPTLDDGMPYPELPDLATPSEYDSVKQVGFSYNTCDYIRFMPGAAIGQQQRLNYTKAIVDMSTPQAKWALRSAPVTGLLSGDIFMSNADLNGESKPWEVGEFDASGRSYTTGNASFWLSVYSKTVVQYGNGTSVQNDTTASAAWSKVTNGMTLSLPPAQGFAVYTWTRSGNNAAVRLPKNDDIYYYYYRNGDKIYDTYEQNLRALRNTNAGGQAGKLAFHPAGSSESYTLSNDSSSTSFVFGNPTMGYIDIWGFVTDNSLVGEISYIDASGGWTTVSRSTAEASSSSNVITNQSRYLPPMHAIVVKTSSASTSKTVTLNTNRIVTAAVCPPLSPAPRRAKEVSLPKGIMTVTAMNPVSPQCTSRLLIGQGYNDAILSGEDAVLSTVNINNYSQTSAPATPFNIYAAEDGYGLSIDLRDSVENIPISFYMSDLPFSPVTNLWFTGVNNIEGPLVFYDALMDSELPIMDGICLNIETPESSHQTRYYIRRYGFKPDDGNQGIATGFETVGNSEDQAMKIIRNGHVLILRNGHVYTMYGQLVR